MLQKVQDRLGNTIPRGFIIAYLSMWAMFVTKMWWMPLLGLFGVLLESKAKVRAEAIFLIAVSTLAYACKTQLANLTDKQQVEAAVVSMAALVVVVLTAPAGASNGRLTASSTESAKEN